MHWRRKWQPTPVFLPGESQGGEAWLAAVYGVTQSRTRPKRRSSSSSILNINMMLNIIYFPSVINKTFQYFSICAFIFALWKWRSLSHVWLCDPMDYTVHGILQTRILEWVAVPFSRVSFQPSNQTQVSHTAGGFFTGWATWETHHCTIRR